MRTTLAVLLGGWLVACDPSHGAHMNGLAQGDGQLGVQAPTGSGVGSLLWASPMQTSDHDVHDFSLAALDDGSLMTAGYFKGTLALSEDGLSQGLALQAKGRQNGFITRHSIDGAALDATAVGEDNVAAVYDVASSGDGGFVLAGAFSNAIDFGHAHLVSRGGLDAFVTRYDRNGNVQWTVPMGGVNHDTAYRLAPTVNGGTWVGGNVFGSGASSAYLALLSRGGTHPASAKLNATQNGHVTVRTVTSGADGGVYAAGDFARGLALDARNELVAIGRSDAWLARYSGGGGLLWGFALGEGAHEIVSVLAAQSGAVNVLGNFRGALRLPGMRDAIESETGSAFVAQLNRNGEAVWVRTLSGTGVTSARHFALASDGGMHITGSYTKALYLGASTDGATASGRRAVLSAVGARDMFVASFTQDGALKWAQTAGGSADDVGMRVVDHAGGATVLMDADVTRGDMHVGIGPDEIARVERAAGDGRHMLLMHYGPVQ